jgi:hypothetical protein
VIILKILLSRIGLISLQRSIITIKIGSLNELGICSYCRPRIFLKVLKRRYMMGKVTCKELPKDHPIFKAGWIISTVRNQSQKIKQYEEERVVKKPKK